MHLTNDQLEEVLQNNAQPSVLQHLETCSPCRQRLEEARAVQDRLRQAFASIHASAALAERIRGHIDAASARLEPSTVQAAPGSLKLRRFWPSLAAAAALVAFALPTAVYFSSPAPAQAGLVAIHQHNLQSSGDFHQVDDPAKLAAHFKEQLGFIPAMPRLNQGLSIRGCCVQKFRDQIVGSYVLDTPHGPVSVIVVKDPPGKLGISDSIQTGQRTIWRGSFSGNSLAALRVGELTYCAVGRVPVENLSQLLVHLFE